MARNHWNFEEVAPEIAEFVGGNGIAREKIVGRAVDLYSAAVQAVEELDRQASAPGLRVDPRNLARAKGVIVDEADAQIVALSKGLRKARKTVQQRVKTLSRRPDPITALSPSDLDRATALRPHMMEQVKSAPSQQLARVVEAAVATNDRATVAVLASLIGPEVDRPQREGEDADRRRQLNDLMKLMAPLLPALAPEAKALIEHAEAELQDIDEALREISTKTYQRERYEQQLLIRGRAYLNVESEEQKAARKSALAARGGFR